jgi:rubrerythrin
MTTQLAGTERGTVAELFVVAVQLETAAQHFYEGLAEMFGHRPEVARFWRLFAADEVVHGKRLAELEASADARKLSQQADARLLGAGRKLLATPVADLLGRVQNLDDAYQIAHDLESSETNTIFRFLIGEFSQDKRVVANVMRDLDEHLERLMTGLPAPYATQAARAAIKPQPPTVL